MQDSRECQQLSACFHGRGTQWHYKKGSMSKLQVRKLRWRPPNTDTLISQLVFETALLRSWSRKKWRKPSEFSFYLMWGRDASTSGFAATILDFWLPCTLNSIDNSSFDKRVLRNKGEAVDFHSNLPYKRIYSCCYVVVVKVLVFPVLKPSYWITG
jgi:hypothetical protein